MLLRLLLATIVASSMSLAALEGPNVCKKEEEFPVEVQVSYHQPYQVKTFKWCPKWPPRCQTTRTAYKVAYKTETHIQRREVDVCCKGYAEVGQTRCIPICSNACLHGKCVAPEQCECLDGYGGDTCNIWHTCPDKTWGPSCQNNCTCSPGSHCDPVTGACTCTPGWRGRDCHLPCEAGYYGFNCQQACRCINGAKCDHINGECICPVGFQGLFCEESCVQDYNCTRSLSRYAEESDSSTASVALIVAGFALMTIAVLALFFVKFKHRFVSLKNDLNFVTYRAEPRPSASDDIENPMYEGAGPRSEQKLNNLHIHNQLNISVKKSNIEKAAQVKQASYAKEFNDLSACHSACEESQPLGACGGNDYTDLKAELKNRALELDNEESSIPINRASNVNIYSSIEHLKPTPSKENVYEEVKSKPYVDESDNSDNETYDQLRADYRPPVGSGAAAALNDSVYDVPGNNSLVVEPRKPTSPTSSTPISSPNKTSNGITKETINSPTKIEPSLEQKKLDPATHRSPPPPPPPPAPSTPSARVYTNTEQRISPEPNNRSSNLSDESFELRY